VLLVMAATLLIVFRSRLRLLPLAIALAAAGITFGLLAVLGAALSGCSNAGSASSPTTPTGSEAPTGTYTLTIVGKDSTSASISASTTATLNID